MDKAWLGHEHKKSINPVPTLTALLYASNIHIFGA